MSERDEPRWLDPDQTKAWIALAATMAWLPSALDAQLRRDAGLSEVEYRVLSWLSMIPGRVARMSQVAQVANLNLSHLSRVAARLESRGWIRRGPDPDDGRGTLATLTDAGWDKVVAAAPGHAEEVQRLVFDHLTRAQVRQLHAIANAILEPLRPKYLAELHAAPPSAAGGDGPA